MALAIAIGFATAGHATAPVARAACDGGFTYDSAVEHAHAALVGVIAETREDGLGFVYASSVTVEHAFGVQVGPVFHGRADVGLCADDSPRVGARVVVLLGVTFADVPGGPSDLFYTEGRTVTAAQVASLAGDLPDTATATLAGSQPGSPLVAMVAGLAALVGLLMRPAPRRPRGTGV
jgi:hypothetical protein